MNSFEALSIRPYRDADSHACRICVAELQGIGRALLHAGERYAWETGATDLRIGVMSENRKARDLYLAEGFAPYSEVLAKIR